MKKNEHIFIAKDSTLNSFEKLVLGYERKGVYAEDSVLVNILPLTRKTKELEKFVGDLTTFLLSQPHDKDLQQIHLHVDGQGRFAYFSVPIEWMEEIKIKGGKK